MYTFAHFWSDYPRRKNKLDAEKAFKSVVKRFDCDKIRDELLVAKDYWKHEGTKPEYIPYPASWLRATDFDDEFEAQEDDKEPSLLDLLPMDHFCKFCALPHRHRCKDCVAGICFGPKEMACLEFLKTLKTFKRR